MASPPTRDFGRRRPVTIPPAASVKRSGHVALLLMGTFAVGGGAYTLMPRENCEPAPPGLATASSPQANVECRPSGSSTSGNRIGSRSGFFSSDPSSVHATAGSLSDSGPGGVTRGGFGSFARAITAHFSGGG